MISCDENGGKMASSELVTLEEYDLLMADRPMKFSASQVGYSPKPKYKQVCDDCISFFRGKAARKNTCEIFRPDNEETVQPMGWCRFWSNNYRDFPLLDKED